MIVPLSGPTLRRIRTRPLRVLLLLLPPSLGACVAASTFLDNPGMEQRRSRELPHAWVFRSSVREGYRTRLTAEHPYEGDRCVLIESVDTPRGPFGNLMQVVDASAYRGKRVRFRAAVRAEVEEGGGAAQMWLRVDREAGRGFFDNMGDRPVRSPQWGLYEIIGEVARDARSLSLGFFLRGEGRAWFDAVSLEILGEVGEGDRPPRPLTERGLENLVAFTRLLGYVRYFHPSAMAEQADWEGLAMAGVEWAEGAGSPAELARIMAGLFAPMAPLVRVFADGDVPAAGHVPFRREDTDRVVWQHRGVGLQSPSIYSSRRIRAPATDDRFGKSLPEADAVRNLPLGGAVTCSLPLVLSAGDADPSPAETVGVRGNLASGQPTGPGLGPGRPAGFLPSGSDRTTRLADIVLAWNVFQHFYPYFDLVEGDWFQALRDALSSAALDPDEAAFLRTLRRLVAGLDDGHGYVGHASEDRPNRIPVLWDWVEDRLVVTAAGPSAVSLKRGDVVLQVNGLPAVSALQAEERLISGATSQWKRYRALQRLGTGSPGEKMEIVYLSGDQRTRRVTLECDTPRYGPGRLVEPRPAKIEEIRPHLFYVDLDRISDEDFLAALPDLGLARGVIFDLRGYPSVSTEVLAHLIEEPVSSARWLVPLVTLPDRASMEYQVSNWVLQPRSPRLEARIVFLTDGRAISYAETYLGIVEHYGLGEIVGSTTAGTNGNVNGFRLPGGYRISWTGMRVLKHDGSVHHGVGIRPTVPAGRTIQGIREGRDEILQKGIEVAAPRRAHDPEGPARRSD